MPRFQFKFLPAEQIGLADCVADLPDELEARAAGFAYIRNHLADELRDSGQIDLRGFARILDEKGFELSRIEFTHAVGVVR